MGGARDSTMIPSAPTNLDRRRPLHHTSCGPPPPLSRGRKNDLVLAARLRPSFANKTERSNSFSPHDKGRRSAERRTIHWPRSRKRVCALCATHLPARQRALRSPLAFRRFAAALVAASERRNSAQAVLHATDKQRERYPRRQSRLSQAPGAPVVLPAGTMPKPPGSGVTSPARRNRTRPIQRLSPVDVPEVSELPAGNTTGDHCQ